MTDLNKYGSWTILGFTKHLDAQADRILEQSNQIAELRLEVAQEGERGDMAQAQLRNQLATITELHAVAEVKKERLTAATRDLKGMETIRASDVRFAEKALTEVVSKLEEVTGWYDVAKKERDNHAAARDRFREELRIEKNTTERFRINERDFTREKVRLEQEVEDLKSRLSPCARFDHEVPAGQTPNWADDYEPVKAWLADHTRRIAAMERDGPKLDTDVLNEVLDRVRAQEAQDELTATVIQDLRERLDGLEAKAP